MREKGMRKQVGNEREVAGGRKDGEERTNAPFVEK